jgi:hypothetical protein
VQFFVPQNIAESRVFLAVLSSLVSLAVPEGSGKQSFPGRSLHARFTRCARRQRKAELSWPFSPRSFHSLCQKAAESRAFLAVLSTLVSLAVGEGIRTLEGTKPTDLESVPFGRSGTPTNVMSGSQWICQRRILTHSHECSEWESVDLPKANLNALPRMQ